MDWVLFSLIYAIFNAMYLNFNTSRHFNGYLLGIIRGFGILFLSLPFLFFVSSKISVSYLIILIAQGVFIGIYDSHIFFSTSKYGASSTFGFMATSLFITLIIWWGIEQKDLLLLLKNKNDFLSFLFILIGISVSYWEMMRVKVNTEAEKFLYPAVFSLSLMSIATRYISLMGGAYWDGIIFYLTVSCGISGIYNLIFFCKNFNNFNGNLPKFSEVIWLIFFSFILIVAKTIAFKEAFNPTFVMAILLISPIIAGIIKNRKLVINLNEVIFFIFVLILILFSKKFQ